MNMSSRIIRASAQSGESTPSESSAQIGRFVFGSTNASAAAAVSAPEGRVQEAAATPSHSDPDSVQQQCERLLQEARLKVSEIEKEAYEKGFSEGQRSGAEVGEKMAEALLKQYAASLEALNKLRKELFATSEREVIRLSLEIARKIIKREVAIDEELILTLVRVALARVADQALITVRVNPKDCHFIERHRAAGLAGPESGAVSESVKLVEDPLIPRGGCIIETESGTIDARIEEQLREIEKGFFE
jgi:flagellar assembly protein FliH